jgi:murein peptide amidase A
MKIKSIRNYSDIQAKLASALDGGVRPVHLGSVYNNVTSYPIEKIVLGHGHSRRVLISAGIHGDEPAGVETICSFVEGKKYLEQIKNWEITLVPCINPFGYESGTRVNHEGVDLNRQFKSSSPPREVVLVQTLFDRPFDLTMELHEDEDSSGYYLFHSTTSDLKTDLASQILNEVQKVMPVNRDSKIDGFPAREGVIDRVSEPQSMKWWPMALYALSKGTRICLTLETAPRFAMENRVNAHLQAIRTALDNFPG